MVQSLWIKYKSIFYYGIFGVITTVVNIITYMVCYNLIGIPNVPSNVIAWVIAVTVAYVTNKLWVFDSKSFHPSVLWPEIWKFVSCRLATGIMDLLIMFVGVDLLHGSSTYIKIGSNILVIVFNYVFSKMVIFRKRDNSSGKID